MKQSEMLLILMPWGGALVMTVTWLQFKESFGFGEIEQFQICFK